MAFYKTKGIIIKRADSGEADRIITVFTENLGKIRVAGRGTRRITSKLASELDLFNYTDFLITNGKNLDIITGAVAIEKFKSLKKDLKRIAASEYLSNLVDRLSAEGHSEKELFLLFKNIFYFLDKEKRNFEPWLIVRNFEWEFLKKSGHKPDFYNCSSCHKKLKPEKNYLSSKGSGIICSFCGQKDQKARLLSNNTIKILCLLEKRDFEKIKKIKLAEFQKKEIKKTLQYFLGNI